MRPSPHLRRGLFGVAAAGVAATMLAISGTAAQAVVLDAGVNLGPVTVANGAVSLTGSVGATRSSAALTVNGTPVAVNTDGTFSATVDLGGASELALAVRDPRSGESVTTRIPLSSNVIGPGGVIPASVLDALEQAAVSILKPADGFEILDGRPLTVGGAVGDRDQLVGLSVNGADVLDDLRSDRTFSLAIPGTSERVTVTATDRQGVSQTSAYDVRHTSTVIATPAGPSVSAAGANGLRIASVRYTTKGVKRTKRIRMTVTVKDRQGRLVRDAIVRVRVADHQVRRQLVRGGQQVKYTTRVGRADFFVRLTRKALGRRVYMVSFAKSPTASVRKTTSVRLPRATARARR